MADARARRRLGPGEFAKYHALGNDYLVLDGNQSPWPTAAAVAAWCDRHRGLGSDGLLIYQLPQRGGAAALRVFNPDGSEAEKSGNGLRIFARFLRDAGYVKGERFAIELPHEQVQARLHVAPPAMGRTGNAEAVESISIAMGAPRFTFAAVGAPGGDGNSTRASIQALGRTWDVSLVSMGNPHCAVFGADFTVDLLRQLGPALGSHACFGNRANVQLVRVLDRTTIELLIWERGAGETQASGSSSCAAVAAAQARSLCDDEVTVVMPGGSVRVRREREREAGDEGEGESDGDGAQVGLWLEGPATPVARMVLWHAYNEQGDR